jgi:hypothetical protein
VRLSVMARAGEKVQTASTLKMNIQTMFVFIAPPVI